jgi:hypothetical protein
MPKIIVALDLICLNFSLNRYYIVNIMNSAYQMVTEYFSKTLYRSCQKYTISL